MADAQRHAGNMLTVRDIRCTADAPITPFCPPGRSAIRRGRVSCRRGIGGKLGQVCGRACEYPACDPSGDQGRCPGHRPRPADGRSHREADGRKRCLVVHAALPRRRGLDTFPGGLGEPGEAARDDSRHRFGVCAGQEIQAGNGLGYQDALRREAGDSAGRATGWCAGTRWARYDGRVRPALRRLPRVRPRRQVDLHAVPSSRNTSRR